jgi:hypothetical protein
MILKSKILFQSILAISSPGVLMLASVRRMLTSKGKNNFFFQNFRQIKGWQLKKGFDSQPLEFWHTDLDMGIGKLAN